MFVSYCKGSHSLLIFWPSFSQHQSHCLFFKLWGVLCSNKLKITFKQWQPWKMQHYSLSPGQLRRCSLLKISPSVKVIGTHAMRPDSLLLPTLYLTQCKTLVFCSASTLLLCRGKVHHKHTLTCTTGTKSALFFFSCITPERLSWLGKCPLKPC